jgi:hypothetical protein
MDEPAPAGDNEDGTWVDAVEHRARKELELGLAADFAKNLIPGDTDRALAVKIVKSARQFLALRRSELSCTPWILEFYRPQIPCAAGEQRVYEFFALTLAGSFGYTLVFQFHRVRRRLQHGIGDGFGTASSKVFKRTRFRR